jgi:ribonuclease HI/exonuclease III
MASSTNILQINCRSLKSHKTDVENIHITTNSHIIHIQETWLIPNTLPPNISNYTTAHQSRDKTGGGVASYFHPSYAVTRIEPPPETPKHYQLTCNMVHTKHNKVIHINVYLPPKPNSTIVTSLTKFVASITQKHRNVMVCGDFNLHHPHWGKNAKATTEGKNVLHAFTAAGLECLNNPKTITRQQTGSKSSALDLTWVSPPLQRGNNQWKTNQTLKFADHLPITFTLPCKPPPSVQEHKMRWLDNADWEKWRADSDLAFRGSWKPPSMESDPAAAVCLFNTILQNAARLSIGQKRVTRGANTWWHHNTDIQRLVKAKRKARTLYMHKREPALQAQINKTRNELHRLVKRANEDRKQKLYSNLHQAPTDRSFFRTLKELSGSAPSKIRPLRDAHGSLHSTNQAKAKLLNQHFATQCNHKQIPREQQYVDEHRSHFEEGGFEQEEGKCELDKHTEQLNADISEDELKHHINIIASKPQTAAGPDGFTTKMIIYAGHGMLLALRQIFQLTWRSGQVPEQWKKAFITPVPKGRGNLTDTSSYRPVSLLSVIGKLLERVVQGRLMQFLTNTNRLPRTQSGSRPGHGTLDHLTRLCTDIWEAQQQGYCVGLILLDLTKAYDRVDRNLVRSQLHKCKVQGRALKWLSSFLHNRTQSVVVEGTQAAEVFTTSGVPQGSPLSPLLFILATADNLNNLQSKSGAFVDDLAMWCKAKDAKTVADILQRDANTVHNWGVSNHLHFSPAKSTLTYFTAKPLNVKPPTILLGNSHISLSRSPKYLGVTLDPQLTWAAHVQGMAVKANQRLGVLYQLHSHYFKKGITANVILKLYKTIIRPTMEYCCPLWRGAKDHILAPLHIIQNKVLRLCTGARRTSPIEALEIDTQIVPLGLRWEQMSKEWVAKIERLPPSHPLTNTAKTSKPAHHYTKNKTSSVPLCMNKQPAHNTRRASKATPEQKQPIRMDPWNHSILPTHLHNKLITRRSPANKAIPMEAKRWAADTLKSIDPADASVAYTDGSCLQAVGSAGAGIFTKAPGCVPTSKGYPLSQSSTNFEAELYAVAQACQNHITHGRHTRNIALHVYTDALTVWGLLANNTYPQTGNTTIFDKLANNMGIILQHTSLTLYWIPSHVGIPGNEKADRMAKEAATHASTEPKWASDPVFPVSLATAKKKIRMNMRRKWQQRWNASSGGRDYFALQPKVTTNQSHAWATNRRADSIQCQLRLNHSILNASRARFDNDVDPDCTECKSSTIETREHYLMHCEQYNSQRYRYYQHAQQIAGPSAHLLEGDSYVSMVLGTHAALSRYQKTQMHKATNDFIKATGRFRTQQN